MPHRGCVKPLLYAAVLATADGKTEGVYLPDDLKPCPPKKVPGAFVGIFGFCYCRMGISDMHMKKRNSSFHMHVTYPQNAKMKKKYLSSKYQ